MEECKKRTSDELYQISPLPLCWMAADHAFTRRIEIGQEPILHADQL